MSKERAFLLASGTFFVGLIAGELIMWGVGC